MKLDLQTVIIIIAVLGLPYALAMATIGIKYGFKKDVTINLLVSSMLSASAYIYLYPVPLVLFVYDIAIFTVPAIVIWIANLLKKVF